MADDVPPMPEDDNAPPADPFEAELVAYLDGELDAVAARKVESRLATDPAVREGRRALKKTFDLLDYLPKPDPSPNFTTKTLDRLPALKAGTVADRTSAPAPSPAAVSSSVPVALATSSLTLPPPEPAPARRGLWAAGVLVAVGLCAAAGYFVASVMRPPQQQVQAPPDELPISDRGVVENLPLYGGADDLDFVRSLAGAEFFGDDSAVSFDAKLKPPQPVEADTPSGAAFEKLAEHFKALPPTRQQAIRELHKQMQEVADRDERERLFRVLEVYAVWLDRLPPGERKSVLGATTAARRLDEIQNLRERQWIESLPPTQRAKLTGLSATEKSEVIGQWRRAETDRRDEWEFVRDHADDIAANRAPWPFEDAAMKKDVVEFVRVAFHTDKAARSRLTANEFDRLAKLLGEANEKAGWAWHAYGKAVYDLTRKYEPWLLPEPATGEPITRPEHLPKQAERYLKGPAAKMIQFQEGKWPDYALTVHNLAQFPKAERLPPLGPAKPTDFKEPLRSFVTKDLSRVLSFPEKRNLDNQEGRWPEYPREVLRLAKQHNLSAPGMMLPGVLRQWESVYRTKPGPGRAVPDRP